MSEMFEDIEVSEEIEWYHGDEEDEEETDWETGDEDHDEEGSDWYGKKARPGWDSDLPEEDSDFADDVSDWPSAKRKPDAWWEHEELEEGEWAEEDEEIDSAEPAGHDPHASEWWFHPEED